MANSASVWKFWGRVVDAAPLRSATLVPMLALGLFLAVVVALLGSQRVQRMLEADLDAQAVRSAAVVAAAAQATAQVGELQRLVFAVAADRQFQSIAVLSGQPARVIAASRQAWVGMSATEPAPGELADLFRHAARDPGSMQPTEDAGSDAGFGAARFYLPEAASQVPTGAVVVVHMSHDKVLATAALVRNRVMLVLALLAAVFAGISVLLTSRRIMAPLALISRVLAARQLGDSAARVQLSANDELDKLGLALNRSFDDIDALTQARAVHDRRTAELFKALRDSEERFRLLADGVADHAIYMLDLEGFVVSWNAGAERISGYTASDIHGLHFSAFGTAEDAAGGAPAQKLEAAARLEKYEEESLQVRKDGSVFWANVVISAVRDEQGHIAGFSKITRDISKSRLVEESARQAAKRYEDLFEYAPVGIWVRQDDRIVLANPAARQMLGGRDLLAARIAEIIHPDDMAVVKAREMRRAAGEEQILRTNMRAVRLDGSTAWLDVSGVQINWNGRASTLGFAIDITGRKNAEEQLREVQKLEAIGQLTGGLAHDFNNLLGIVVGNLDEISADLPPSGRVRRQHTAALDAALRGAEVTRSLLAVARRQPLEVNAYDLNALVVEMLPLLNASAGSAVKVLSQFAPGAMMARLDAGGLSNVVLNLAINARDAMQDMAGERVLTLRTRREQIVPGAGAQALAPGWYAVLEVCDNGHGMSQSVREQAFEPFFTTKARGKGTGLGLAMVYGYATQLGGTAQIESAEGTGTTLRLYLPMEMQQAQREEAAEAKRLEALRALKVLDTAPQEDIDALVRQAAELCHTPIALVSLVDEQRQWFKSKVGLQASQTPREHAFCAHAILSAGQTLVVPDAHQDPRFSGNPLVNGPPNVTFYAGAPLLDGAGNALGTLCVIDHHPRTLGASELQALEAIASRISVLLAGASPGQRALEPLAAPPAAAVAQPPQGAEPPDDVRVLVVDDEPALCELACSWLESLGYTPTGVHSPLEALEQLSGQRFYALFTDVVMPGPMDGITLAREALRRQPDIRVVLSSGFAQRLFDEPDPPGPLLKKPYRKKELSALFAKVAPLAPSGPAVAPPGGATPTN